MSQQLRFRPKNLVVEAFQFGIDEMPNWFLKAKNIFMRENHCVIISAGGESQRADFGDYVLQSLAGDIFCCREKTFQKVFEVVNHA